MYTKLTYGWIWADMSPAGALAPERTRDVYAISHVLETSLERRGAAPMVPRFVALHSANHHASGGSFYVRLGAVLMPGPTGVLTIEVAVGADDSGLDVALAEEVLLGAREAAADHDFAGILRFDRGRVHPVDCKVHRYRTAARALTNLLAELPTIADDARLGERFTMM